MILLLSRNPNHKLRKELGELIGQQQRQQSLLLFAVKTQKSLMLSYQVQGESMEMSLLINNNHFGKKLLTSLLSNIFV